MRNLRMTQEELDADIAGMVDAEERHLQEAVSKRGRQASTREDEGELEAEVRTYAAEHKCSLGNAYVAIGAKHARDEWEAAREQERHEGGE
jgi:hypothetical protein